MDAAERSHATFSTTGTAEVERLGSHALVAAVQATSPDMAALLVDVALGGVLGRPDLDARTRELLAVAMLSALGADADFVGVHARAALEAGASAAELVEVVMQVVTFAGFPPALRALAVVQGELEQAGLPPLVPRSARAVVVAFFEALTAGDIDVAVDLAAPDAVWAIPGDAALLPWVGEHRGRDAVRAFYALLGAETETESLHLGPVIAYGDLVLVRGEFAYRFPRHGGRYAGAFVVVFTIDNGLIQRYEMHEDSLGLARAFQNQS